MNGFQQDDAAKLLLIGRSYLSQLENEAREPGPTLVARFTALEAESSETLRQRLHGIEQRSPRPTSSPREKLRSALDAHHLSISQFAKRIKRPTSIVERIVDGTGSISESTAKAIVKEFPEFDFEVEELLSGSDTPRIIDETGRTGTYGAKPTITIPGKNPTRYVPLLSWGAAGALSSIDALDEAYEHEGIASSVPGRAFAIEVRGDSMHPEINPGDYAVVRADIAASPGGVVVVRTIHGDVLCKRFQTKDGGKIVILSSVNHSYQPIEIPASEIAWIYPVKQVIRNY